VTAHAKAFGLGIPAFDLAAQGFYYVWNTAVDDPALLATVVAGVCVGLRTPGRRLLTLGVLLYLGFVVKVGGDFMAGRFFLPPFAVAVTLLADRLARSTPRACGLVALAAIACMAWALPPWLRGPASDTKPADAMAAVDAARGIVDERRMYYERLGLLAPARNQPGFERPRFGSLERLVWPQGRAERWFLLQGAVGVAGFQAGSSGHIVDPLLCDPLIARLPAIDPEHWRIGHVLRRIPEGYWETLAWGENRVHHAGLRRYVDALMTIGRAPVFAAERWRMIARMRFGEFDADLAAFVAEQYRKPPRVSVPAANVATRLAPGTYWFDEPRLRVVYEGGVAVEFAERVVARSLRVQVVGLCQFRFRFLSKGVELGSADGVPVADGAAPASLAQQLSQLLGVREVQVAVPAGVEGFDAIWVDLFGLSDNAPGPAALGAVVLAP
jgi:arabinofuranosyltransferase